MPVQELFVGALGGFIASFAGQFGWRAYRKPDLELSRETPTEFILDEEYKRIEYRIEVRNRGKTAAKNCRPKLMLKGKRKNTKYVIEATSHWSESSKPTTTTINSDDTISFPVYRYYLTKESKKDVPSYYPHYRFPTEDGWEENIENVYIYHLNNEGEVENMSFSKEIVQPHFDDIEWEQRTVTVTAQNTGSVSGKFWEEQTERLEGLGEKQIVVEES